MAICRCRAARAIGKAILRLFATGNTAAIPVQHSDVASGSQLGYPERERQRPQSPSTCRWNDYAQRQLLAAM